MGDNLIEKMGFWKKKKCEINLKHVRVWWEIREKLFLWNLHFTLLAFLCDEISFAKLLCANFMWRNLIEFGLERVKSSELSQITEEKNYIII